MFRFPFISSEIFNAEIVSISDKFFEAPEDPVVPEPELSEELTEVTKATEDSEKEE
jgi:hypothetical protein